MKRKKREILRKEGKKKKIHVSLVMEKNEEKEEKRKRK